MENLAEAAARGEEDSPPTAGSLPWTSVWLMVLALAAVAAAATQLLRNPSGGGFFMPVLAMLVCILAAGFDAATSRIPNAITYTAILLGLALNSLALGAHWAGFDALQNWLGAAGPVQALEGFAVCGTIGLFCVALAGMGGGDMKLLAAMGAILGLANVGAPLIYALIIAVVYALVNLAIAGRLNAALRLVAMQGLSLVFFREIQPAAANSRRTIPLAVPVLLGLMVSRLAPGLLAKWLGGAIG